MSISQTKPVPLMQGQRAVRKQSVTTATGIPCLSTMSWDELTEWASSSTHTDVSHRAVEIEFLRREVLFQKEASDAARDTAKSTMHNAKYMLWSVFALTISALLQALAMLMPTILRLRGVHF